MRKELGRELSELLRDFAAHVDTLSRPAASDAAAKELVASGKELSKRVTVLCAAIEAARREGATPPALNARECLAASAGRRRNSCLLLKYTRRPTGEHVCGPF